MLVFFSVAFFVLGFLFLLVAAWAGVGIYQMLRSSHESQLYLQASQSDKPLAIDHLPSSLQRLATETRMLRISLEAPVRVIAEYRQQTTTQDADAIDNMLMGLTRQLVEWVDSVDALPENERQVLEDLGVTAEPIRHAIRVEGGAYERRNIRRLGPPMDHRLRDVVATLARMEESFQTVSIEPYR